MVLLYQYNYINGTGCPLFLTDSGYFQDKGGIEDAVIWAQYEDHDELAEFVQNYKPQPKCELFAHEFINVSL